MGLLISALLIQWLYNKYGFRVPFLTLYVSDVLYAMICVILSVLGYITNKTPEEKRPRVRKNYEMMKTVHS